MSGGGRPEDGPVLVLLSGGVDSAACVDLYQARGREVAGLFVDYGQAARRAEHAAAGAVAAHYGIGLRCLELRAGREAGPGLVPGRNGFLVFAALLDGAHAGTISLGVHAGTAYYDCSPAFIDHMDQVVRACSGGAAGVEAPLVHWHKHQIWEYARDHGVPVHLAWSCEAGGDSACGVCPSCGDVRVEQLRQDALSRHGG